MNEKATKNIAELVRSLKHMNDGGGCSFLLGRLETLSRAIQVKNEPSDEDIEEVSYLQIQILDQVRHVLDYQDEIISKLKDLVSDIYADPDKSDMVDFLPSPKRLQALRSLENLFMYDNLGYDDKVCLCELKTWADIYGFDLEMVKCLLGNEEIGKPAGASI